MQITYGLYVRLQQKAFEIAIVDTLPCLENMLLVKIALSIYAKITKKYGGKDLEKISLRHHRTSCSSMALQNSIKM